MTGATATVAVPAQASVASATAIVMSGTAGANAWVDDDSNASFAVSGTRQEASVRSSVVFGLPASATFGTTGPELPTSGQHPVGAGAALTLVITGETVTCSLDGSVTVRELTFTDAGLPATMALDWVGDCDGQRHGQVRIASAVPYGGIDVREFYSWSTAVIGEVTDPFSFVVTGHGTQASAVESVDIASAATTDSFVVMHQGDSCTGVTLAHLQTCEVTVGAAARSGPPADQPEWLVLETGDGRSSATALQYAQREVSERGRYVTVAQTRLMDTRTGTGVRVGALGARSTVSLQVHGTAGLPMSGIGSVVLNVTAVGATESSFVSVYPGGTARPTVSSLNLTRGFAGANLVTVPVGESGLVDFYNAAGAVHLVADVVGWYAKGPRSAALGADFFPTVPERVFDSRSDWRNRRLGPREYFPVTLDYPGYEGRITSLVVNVTATGSTGAGFLSLVPARPSSMPATSSLNYPSGATVANLATVAASTVQLGGTGQYPRFWVVNSGSASTHVVVDVVGVYATPLDSAPGLRFRPLPPQRVLDTRSDLGVAGVGSGVATPVPAPASVGGWDTWALSGNLTGIGPTAPTWLTLWDEGPRPPVSTLNLAWGATRPNAVVAGLNGAFGYRVFNASGATETVLDVGGSFEAWPASLETLGGYPWSPGDPAALQRREAMRDRVPAPADGRLAQLPQVFRL
ncbi:MAG: hypothetical protein ACRCY8_02315 [Dermatophilaceae bacterium]